MNKYWFYSNVFNILIVEVEQMLLRDEVELASLDSTPLDSDLSSGPHLTSHPGSSSGGYAHNIFIRAAKELFNQDIDELHWKVLR